MHLFILIYTIVRYSKYIASYFSKLQVQSQVTCNKYVAIPCFLSGWFSKHDWQPATLHDQLSDKEPGLGWTGSPPGQESAATRKKSREM